MIAWQLGHGILTKRLGHLCLKRLGVQAVHIVVAIIAEQQPAVFHETHQATTLGLIEAHQLVARHENEGKSR